MLSPGQWRSDDGKWIEPGIGGIVHTPAGVTHSMRAADDPLLAVWFHVDQPRTTAPVSVRGHVSSTESGHAAPIDHVR